MVAGWVMSARNVVIPSRGLMGCKSIATILTSFRGLSSSSTFCSSDDIVVWTGGGSFP